MTAYWIEFKNFKSGCVEADTETAAMVAARLVTGKEPIKATKLPYPAVPRLVKKEYTDPKGNKYHIPSFCYKPDQCKGKSCCPQSYSCTE